MSSTSREHQNSNVCSVVQVHDPTDGRRPRRKSMSSLILMNLSLRSRCTRSLLLSIVTRWDIIDLCWLTTIKQCSIPSSSNSKVDQGLPLQPAISISKQISALKRFLGQLRAFKVFVFRVVRNANDVYSALLLSVCWTTEKRRPRRSTICCVYMRERRVQYSTTIFSTRSPRHHAYSMQFHGPV